MSCSAEKQKADTEVESDSTVDTFKIEEPLPIPGAASFDEYLPILEGKKVGLVVNHTSLIGDVHLLDTLLAQGITVTKIYAPEHGFRGEADAGAHIESSVDSKTGVPIFSVYGSKRKPDAKDLENVDILVFDIQDVGARFYTYISTMHYMMEASAENNKKMLVLDRPNPNGDYIAGPIRAEGLSSFVGLDPIPLVHGLTVGELAQMINGEGWLAGNKSCDLTVIPVKNYDHNTKYSLPVAPSPNLPNDVSIRLYPSLCLFEATVMSIGRGTDFPFQVVGYPDSTYGDFEFTPVSMPGKSTHPKLENKKCFGVDLRNTSLDHQFTLKYIIDFYKKASNHTKYIDRSQVFNRLAGNTTLQQQLKDGLSEEEIVKSWEPELAEYRQMREQYLLYPDFE
ncbi:exo-beta-N-acetylmuramidase NamZ family protein [Chondrinema litorale]|uniref:exo-beta-N-acetylmuramidase NamZ family protein n=1 Tax=Chondrinema litorale TaxID=2994555 RepID=UPI00254337E7|nr:DUF1343 domain-containing protein [Chondrinema litorale]UZR95147.1 DUF1343 domain-containing protein [Chondrinema litorale]